MGWGRREGKASQRQRPATRRELTPPSRNAALDESCRRIEVNVCGRVCICSRLLAGGELRPLAKRTAVLVLRMERGVWSICTDSTEATLLQGRVLALAGRNRLTPVPPRVSHHFCHRFSLPPGITERRMQSKLLPHTGYSIFFHRGRPEAPLTVVSPIHGNAKMTDSLVKAVRLIHHVPYSIMDTVVDTTKQHRQHTALPHRHTVTRTGNDGVEQKVYTQEDHYKGVDEPVPLDLDEGGKLCCVSVVAPACP